MRPLKPIDCLQKRDLLNRQPIPRETLVAYAEHYRALGAIHDAVDFWERAEDFEALEEVLTAAREEGDVFLVRRLSRILGREVTPLEWLELRDRAEALGKLAFAQAASAAAGEQPKSP